MKGARGGAEAARLVRVGAALDEVRARCDVRARLAADPVSIVHRYADPADRELVAMLASAVAFGNAKAFRAKLEDALARIGPDVARAADDARAVHARLEGWRHRVYVGSDLASLLVGARRVQVASGSLGARLSGDLAREGDLRPALAAFVSAIRREGGLDRGRALGRRGAAHVLADPAGASGCKRLLLLLRWMARPADGVDLGLWPIPASKLLVPVDTHVHKLARNLGLTRRDTLGWATTEEITAALARYDAADPVKYDFALCHLGMVQRCPSRRDPVRCEGCGVLPVCRHWAARPGRPPAGTAGSSGPRARGAGRRASR